jgi:hypothetical protein
MWYSLDLPTLLYCINIHEPVSCLPHLQKAPPTAMPSPNPLSLCGMCTQDTQFTVILSHQNTILSRVTITLQHYKSSGYNNIDAPSYNHCCSEKALSITYPERVFEVLCIQHAMRMDHIFIRGLSGSTIFSHFNYYTVWFSEKVFKHKICFDLLCNVFCNISYSKEQWARYDKN